HAASLTLRKTVLKLLPKPAARAPLDAFGAALAQVLGDPGQASRLRPSAEALCEVAALDGAAAAARSLGAGDDLEAAAPARNGTPPPLDRVVLDVHRRRTEALRQAGREAAVRLLDLLRALAMPQLRATLGDQSLLGVAAATLALDPIVQALPPDLVAL